MGLRPAKVTKNGFCSATTLNGSAALPFVISTGAPKERSGEICGQRSFLEAQDKGRLRGLTRLRMNATVLSSVVPGPNTSATPNAFKAAMS